MPLTQDTGVRVPVPELFAFLLLYFSLKFASLIDIIGVYLHTRSLNLLFNRSAHPAGPVCVQKVCGLEVWMVGGSVG